MYPGGCLSSLFGAQMKTLIIQHLIGNVWDTRACIHGKIHFSPSVLPAGRQSCSILYLQCRDAEKQYFFCSLSSLYTTCNLQHFRKIERLIQKDANSVISTYKRSLCGHFQISGLRSFIYIHLLQQMLSVSFKGNVIQDDKTSRKIGGSAKHLALCLRDACCQMHLHFYASASTVNWQTCKSKDVGMRMD